MRKEKCSDGQVASWWSEKVFLWCKKSFFCVGAALFIFAAYHQPDGTGFSQENEARTRSAQIRADSLSEEIETANDRLASLALQIEDLDAEIRSNEEEIARLNDSLLHIREEKEQLRQYLYKFIQYQYESRMDFSLQAAFLRSKSFADFLNRQNYISAVIESFWDKMKEYDDIDALILKRTEELEGLKQEQEGKRKEYEEAQEHFKEQIASLSEELKEAEKEADAASGGLSERLAEMEEWERKMQESMEFSLPEDEWAWSENIISDGTDFWESQTEYPYSGAERILLAGIIQAEAGNQPYAGKIAVGSVVMNRVEDDRFPNTVAGVVYSPNQFTPAGSGRLAVILAEGPSSECIEAAEAVLRGRRNVSGLYFKSADYAASHGITGIQIADQVFY